MENQHMFTVHDLSEYLAQFAPPRLAEEWDNVGLLVGDSRQPVRRVMTCLTVTPASVAEAVAERADLIVTHHPLPFQPLKRLTADHTPGRLLLDLIAARIAVYSPHTAFDSAAAGINQQLAEALGLSEIEPLVPKPAEAGGQGAGRRGRLGPPIPLSELAERLKAFLHLQGLQLVGDLRREIQHVAVACGAAGEFLAPAWQAGCQVLVTGETNFHTCLEAEAREVALLLPGHYASERFAVETLAGHLQRQFGELVVWPSRQERDPLRWI